MNWFAKQWGARPDKDGGRQPSTKVAMTNEERADMEARAEARRLADAEAARLYEEAIFNTFKKKKYGRECYVEDGYVFNVVDHRAVPITNISALHVNYAPGCGGLGNEWNIVPSYHFAVYAQLKMGKGYYEWGEPLQYFFDYEAAANGLADIAKRIADAGKKVA